MQSRENNTNGQKRQDQRRRGHPGTPLLTIVQLSVLNTQKLLNTIQSAFQTVNISQNDIASGDKLLQRLLSDVTAMLPSQNETTVGGELILEMLCGLFGRPRLGRNFRAQCRCPGDVRNEISRVQAKLYRGRNAG